MAYRSLFDAAVRSDVLARIDVLTPNRRPRWGTLDAHRVLCHMTDALHIGLGELDAGPVKSGFMTSRVGQWLVIDSPFPWPKGVAVPEVFFTTAVEANQFERDRMRLHHVIGRFAQGSAASQRWGVSPVFGVLGPEQWARLSARHCDHHLKQFSA